MYCHEESGLGTQKKHSWATSVSSFKKYEACAARTFVSGLRVRAPCAEICRDPSVACDVKKGMIRAARVRPVLELPRARALARGPKGSSTAPSPTWVFSKAKANKLTCNASWHRCLLAWKAKPMQKSSTQSSIQFRCSFPAPNLQQSSTASAGDTKHVLVSRSGPNAFSVELIRTSVPETVGALEAALKPKGPLGGGPSFSSPGPEGVGERERSGFRSCSGPA